jgi:hypothetical protein
MAKAFRDFRVFRGLKKAAQLRKLSRAGSAALQNIRLIRGLKEFQENLEKSIDILLHVQLKGAPSLALARSAAGELTTGKNKKSGKTEKSVDAFLAFRYKRASQLVRHSLGEGGFKLHSVHNHS